MADNTLKIEHVRAAVKELRAMEKRIGELATNLEARLEGSATVGEQMATVTKAFGAAWSKRYGRTYVHAGVKDATAVKRLIKTLPVDDLIARIGRYLANDDPFFVKSYHPIALFASTINQHGAGQAGLLEDAPAGPVGCRHVPPCATDVEHTRRARREVMGR